MKAFSNRVECDVQEPRDPCIPPSYSRASFSHSAANPVGSVPSVLSNSASSVRRTAGTTCRHFGRSRICDKGLRISSQYHHRESPHRVVLVVSLPHTLSQHLLFTHMTPRTCSMTMISGYAFQFPHYAHIRKMLPV